MNTNISSKFGQNESSDDLLYKCWGHQDCLDCLPKGPCSWCPVSSTCAPNTSPMQILAPVLNIDICPLWSERWELRARPFSCHVSTVQDHVFDIFGVDLWDTFGNGVHHPHNEVYGERREKSGVVEGVEAISEKVLEKKTLSSS
ncbi:hypothetical protein EAF04_005493 [Stromatinia cepivora]|nr:hypothetical protein EAF04_005493 [Stromatinia cepivora]